MEELAGGWYVDIWGTKGCERLHFDTEAQAVHITKQSEHDPRVVKVKMFHIEEDSEFIRYT